MKYRHKNTNEIVKTIAKKITAIIAATRNVAKSMTFTPLMIIISF